MKWANSLFLDGGLNYLKANCDELRLIQTYAANDSYATVVANSLSHVSMTSTDLIITGAASSPRIVTSATGKSDPSASANGGGATLHFAFCDSINANVLWVTKETTGQNIYTGNIVNYPSLVYTSDQPI
jgi:hypothetical protein